MYGPSVANKIILYVINIYDYYYLIKATFFGVFRNRGIILTVELIVLSIPIIYLFIRINVGW